MGEAYQQLTTSLPFDFDSVIADKADIIATISIDKDIIDVNEVNGKSVGSIGGITRWIHFRDDNFNVDCGGRFRNIVDKVELSVDNYIKAIEDAIKHASGKSDNEIEVTKKKEVEERIEKAHELAETSKEVDEELNKQLVTQITEKFPKVTAEVKAKVKELLSENKITLKDTDTGKTSVFQSIVKVLDESLAK